MTVAFVLTGGGSVAATQIGMLQALTEHGVRPDLVVGTSSGAINAVGFAQDPTPEGLARLARVWRGLRRRDVFPLRLRDVAAGLVGWRRGVLSPQGVRAVITTMLQVPTLEDTRIPVHVVASELGSDRPVVISNGPVLPALLASTAMPGVFPPVTLGGRVLLDGGLAANTPVRQAESHGATVSYVLPALRSDGGTSPPRGAFPVLLAALEGLMGHVSETDLAAATGQVHVIPPLHGSASPFDFHATDALITAGHTAACEALAALADTADPGPRRNGALPPSVALPAKGREYFRPS